MNKTNIPWADFTWNPTTGCTFGCEWCYARGVAHRFSSFVEYEAMDECRAARDAVFPYGFMPTIYPHRLDEPLRRKKPAVIFLGSMGDVFDPAIPDSFRDRIFATVAAAQQHTFVVLTKRAEAMRAYFTSKHYMDVLAARFDASCARAGERFGGPLSNLVLGVSVTNQADANVRIPLLLATPAAKRMVSVEPMLEPVSLRWLGPIKQGPNSEYDGLRGLDFVAVGGKTPGKPLHAWRTADELGPDRMRSGDPNFPETVAAQPVTWLRSLRDQCRAAGVPFHYKHGGTNPPLDGVVYDAALRQRKETP